MHADNTLSRVTVLPQIAEKWCQAAVLICIFLVVSGAGPCHAPSVRLSSNCLFRVPVSCPNPVVYLLAHGFTGALWPLGATRSSLAFCFYLAFGPTGFKIESVALLYSVCPSVILHLLGFLVTELQTVSPILSLYREGSFFSYFFYTFTYSISSELISLSDLMCESVFPETESQIHSGSY